MRHARLSSTLRAVSGVAIAVTLISVTQVAAAPREQLFASPTGLSGRALVVEPTAAPELATSILQPQRPRLPTSHRSIPALWGDPVTQTPNFELQEVLEEADLTSANDLPPAPTDCTVIKCVAITIDDGPGPHTEALLAQLAAAAAVATFFVVGAQVARYPDLTAAIVSGGHELGLHSHTHPRMPALGDGAIIREFERSRAAIDDAVDLPVSIYRPPYGVHSKRVGRLAEAAVIMWDVDPQDWRRGNQRNLASHVLKRVQPGSIVLLHELPQTVKALPEILAGLHSAGYQLVTVSELFGANLFNGEVYRAGPAPDQ
jgi:peptidoglycan/xylan/chitin deacetylase (PgdA/CDA1 family)